MLANRSSKQLLRCCGNLSTTIPQWQQAGRVPSRIAYISILGPGFLEGFWKGAFLSLPFQKALGVANIIDM